MRAADRAVPMVGVQDHHLEGLLAEPVRSQPRVTEHGTGPVPGLAEVQLDRGAESQPQDVREVPCHGGVGHVVAFALHDVGCELRRRVGDGAGREEADVADEQAADHRVLTASDRGRRYRPIRARISAMLATPFASPKNSHASETRRRAESLKKPPADQLVVREVGLEEERLAGGQDPELAGTAWLPEIDLGYPWPICQELVPAVIGYPHISPHTVIVHRQPIHTLRIAPSPRDLQIVDV
jgi:hypothetical protein